MFFYTCRTQPKKKQKKTTARTDKKKQHNGVLIVLIFWKLDYFFNDLLLSEINAITPIVLNVTSAISTFGGLLVLRSVGLEVSLLRVQLVCGQFVRSQFAAVSCHRPNWGIPLIRYAEGKARNSAFHLCVH